MICAINNCVCGGGGKKRILYLDYSRVLVALLVIYGHVLPYSNYFPRTFIYSFHMAFFFIVSGMLHKYKETIDWKKYLRTLIVPALFFNVILWIISTPLFYFGIWDYAARYKDVLPDTLLEAYIYMAAGGIKAIILGRGIAPSGPCWFLFALFFCKIASDLIDRYSLRKLLPVFILLFVVCTLKHKSLFCFGNAIMSIPFFFFGHHFRHQITNFIDARDIRQKLFYSIVLLILTIGLTHVNGQVSMWNVSYGSKWPLPISFVLFHLNAFCGSFMFLFASSLLKKPLEKIVTIANSLITILGFQVFFIFFCWYDFPILTTPLLGLLVSVGILFGCHGVHRIIIKYAPFLIGK